MAETTDRGTAPGKGRTGGGSRVIVTRSEEETGILGRLLGEMARPGDVVALAGPLGAGKTRLVHGIARGMGIVEPIPSPTFNLLLVHGGATTLFHFDLYRLERASQLEDIDFYATLESGGVSVIEWADRFPEYLPDDRVDIRMEPVSITERRLTIEPRGSRSPRLARRLVEAWEHAMGEEAGRR